MTISASAEPRFDLSGGALCLDFANTLEDRNEPRPDELLLSYADLVAFALESNAIDPDEARQLSSIAERNPDYAIAALATAIELREATYRIFSAIADGEMADESDLGLLNDRLAAFLPHGRIEARGEGYAWVWTPLDEEATDVLHRPVWPVAYSAMELLLEGDLSRLRECAADDCGWLFLDTTRNRSRRWCSMQTCGNRAKVQGFRERQREGTGDSG